MKISVVIPTYRRPQDLQRCLEALQQQTRLADEVLLIVRDTDADTWSWLRDFNCDRLLLQIVTVQVPGVVAAMNRGLEAATGDIITFTDDDAGPHPTWLAKIEACFQASEQIGGVGGRDWVYHGTELEAGAREIVGKVQWSGRVIGNHHIGIGAAREVDVLKGVNMSFRRTAIQGLWFDSRMRGTGAQVHFELAFSLAVRQRGWQLIYDPAIAVDHFRGQRFDEDQRDQFNALAFSNAVHNETLALLEHFSVPQRLIFVIWAVLIGTSSAPGFLQYLRFLPRGAYLAQQKLFVSLAARWLACQTWWSSYQPPDLLHLPKSDSL
ncbi:glycosyltransferase family 2 protein [Phormidesmis sp. 146-33]